VFVPDSHGEHIDLAARDAFLADLAQLKPDEIVLLGDHLDAGGTFSTHQRAYTNEMTESYMDDVSAANEFFDRIQKAAPDAKVDYLEGNHEQHVERWATREFASKKDADMVLEFLGPVPMLKLKQRGWRYYRRAEHYMGLSVPGTIRLGKIYATHGIAHSKNAAAVHVERFGANVVFGHIHRSQSFVTRTVVSDAQGAWCPGTLAKLQPLYRHTAPSNWSHGFGVQFVASTGTFFYANVPIYRGRSDLMNAIRMVRGRR
jgi:predicted phosphodiesterase